jgi:signal transduction histidine kinase
VSTLDKEKVAPELKFQLLWETGQELGEVDTPEQFEQCLSSILQSVSSFSGGSASINLFDSSSEQPLLNASLGSTGVPELFEKQQAIGAQAIKEKRTLHFNDASDETGSVVVTPIQFKKSFYGTLSVSKDAVRDFSAEGVEFIEGVARQLGVTIHHLEVHREHAEAVKRVNEAAVMSALGESAMEVAHRLGNDLGMWPYYLGDIREALQAHGTGSASSLEKLDRVLTSAGTLRQMAKDLRSNIAGLLPQKCTAIPVRALIEESLSTLRIPQNIRVDQEIQDGLPVLNVVADQVAGILHNLFLNSIEAMPDGGKISVRAAIENARDSGPSRYVVIEVTDTGCGIQPQYQNNVFRLFFSTKNSSGLWSARQFARANGGDLTFEQRSSRGATFVLRLPTAPESEASEP